MKKLKISQEKFGSQNKQNKEVFLTQAGPEWERLSPGGLELTLTAEMSAHHGKVHPEPSSPSKRLSL